VTLAKLHHKHPDWIADDALLGRIVKAASAPGDDDGVEPPETGGSAPELRDPLDQCLNDHRALVEKTQGVAWPPSSAHRRKFLEAIGST
jgi:hypothetical protein